MVEPDPRVLVVDDEVFFREAISEVLGSQGCECILCEDGEQALEVQAELGLGVVVLDIRLPGIDGLEVLRRIRASTPDARVIMLSASVDQELVLEALRLGACDYLAKPLHEEELILAVGRALEGHTVAAQWDYLRGRLDRLVHIVHDLAQRAASGAPDERFAILRQGCVEAAADLLDARKVSLMLINEDETELEVVATVGRVLDPSEMDRVALGEGIAGKVLASREAMLVRRIEDDDRIDGVTELGRYESESFALTPLEAGGRPLGVLCVTDREGALSFGEDDLSLLRLLGLQISELMDGVFRGAAGSQAPPASDEDDLDQTEERWDDAELARLVCDAVVSEVEPSRIIDAVLRPLSQTLGAAPVSVFLIDPGSGELVREGECDGGLRAERQKLENGRGLTGVAVQNGSLIATADPASDPRFDREIDTPENGEVAPLMIAPLRLRGRVFGVFRAFFEVGEIPSARTGEVLSAALSAAFRNVLLYRSLIDSIAEVAEVRRETNRGR